MTVAGYSAAMVAVRSGRLRAMWGIAAVGVVIGLGACGDDDSSSDTLEPLDGAPNGTGPGAVTTTAPVSALDTAVDPALAGSGFVSIELQLPATGVREAISLDRASVRADQLDPVSLDATCTALDGGDLSTGTVVTVVDLRRMGSTDRLVSATIRVAGDSAAGEHDVTIDVGDADQVTTTYTGTIELADGAMSGTFEATDESGDSVTGTYVCAPVAVTTTAPIITGGGEEVPDSASDG